MILVALLQGKALWFNITLLCVCVRVFDWFVLEIFFFFFY